MNIFQSKMSKALKKYIECQGRVQKTMQKLIEVMKQKSKDRSLIAVVKAETKTKVIFKIMVLINKLLIDNAIEMDYCGQILDGLKMVPKNDMEKQIITIGLKPYLRYLQRRNQERQNPSQEQGQLQKINQIYKLINMVNLGTSFTQLLYTIGRYYNKEFPFAIDFNITLGTDIKKLYDRLAVLIKGLDDYEILKEIERSHEKMFLVYYNLYYSDYMDIVGIEWIQTYLHKQKPSNLQEQQEILITQIATTPILFELYRVFEVEQQEPEEAQKDEKSIKTAQTSPYQSQMDLCKRTPSTIEQQGSAKSTTSLQLIENLQPNKRICVSEFLIEDQTDL